MMKYLHLYFLLFVFGTFCMGQTKTDLSKENIKSATKDVIPYTGPKTITRNIIQDRKGNIWMAAFDGIFRYDGKSFTHVTREVSSARFFSVLEDRNGNFWFGSIGSGVYYYDGKSFQNFTTKEGLLSNGVVSIYEDKKGNIWFGVFGGASCYNGKSFRNYIMDGNAMKEELTGKTFSERQPNEVNAILEDRNGNFWFATRGKTYVYNGKTWTVITPTFPFLADSGKSFTNVRSIIEDKKGTIWLGGNDGLWRYEGITFTNLTSKFVGFIYEDRKGNTWTSSEKVNHQFWALSRYDAETLSNDKPIVTEIKSGERMIFGILEASDGSIWFGTINGVCRYNGKTFEDFKD